MELIEYAKLLRDNCKNRKACTLCPFNSSGKPANCDISFSHYAGEVTAKPCDWDLENKE